MRPVKPAKPHHLLLPNSYSYSNPNIKRYIPDDSTNSDFHYEKQGQTRHVEKQQHSDYYSRAATATLPSPSPTAIQTQFSTIIPTRNFFCEKTNLNLLFFI